LFQRHTQLTMIRYFNDATVRGANADLPQFSDLINIIHFKKWTHLIPLPARYFVVPRGVNHPPAPPLPPAFAPALPPALAPALPPRRRPGTGPCRCSIGTPAEPRPRHRPLGSFRPHPQTSRRLGASR
jgi:hypothetical protein